MAQVYEQRIQYRRYEDRRMAVLLAIYELMFELPPGTKRDELVLKAIKQNYKVDRAAFIALSPPSEGTTGALEAMVGNWTAGNGSPTKIAGAGFSHLMSLHEDAVGALGFESVRRPNLFSQEVWDNLWQVALGDSARALLSMEIRPKSAKRRLIWLQQTSSTREWSSRDRELIEEIAVILARALDKSA